MPLDFLHSFLPHCRRRRFARTPVAVLVTALAATFIAALFMLSIILASLSQPAFAGDTFYIEGKKSVFIRPVRSTNGTLELSMNTMTPAMRSNFTLQTSLTDTVFVIAVPSLWRFTSGDNPRYASPDLDDSTDSKWRMFPTLINPYVPNEDISKQSTRTQEHSTQGNSWQNLWHNIGWFRLRIRIDSTLQGKSVIFLVQQAGASEIFVNGKFVQRYGVVSGSPVSEQRYSTKSLPVLITFNDSTAAARSGEYVIAIRYSNTRTSDSFRNTLAQFLGLSLRTYVQPFGFGAVLMPLGSGLDVFDSSELDALRDTHLLAIGIFCAFTLLHSLLFLFYPKQRENLWYSLFTGTLAVRYWIVWAQNSSTNPDLTSILNMAPVFYSTALVALITAFMYSTFYDRMPRGIWIMSAACLLCSLIVFFFSHRQEVQIFWAVFLAVASFEAVRVAVLAIRNNQKTAWILLFGALDFAVMWVIRFALNATGTELAAITYNAILLGGYMSMPVAMSIYIALKVSRTNHSLEAQVLNVKELSQKSIEQERRVRDQEMRQRLLESDNARKTAELEEARALQIAMLPRTVPQHDRFDIATYMRTATEVGGDYYDFKLDAHTDDDAHTTTLLAAVGDATGHGMKAGFLVSTTKSYVQMLQPNEHAGRALERISGGIRTMNMRGMYMCLVLVKMIVRVPATESTPLLVGKTVPDSTPATTPAPATAQAPVGAPVEVSFANAGVPPMLVYRAASATTERITMKALPLGSISTPSYTQDHITLLDDDVLLIMSDGLPELFNTQREMLDYDRIESCFAGAANGSAPEIIKALCDKADAWSNGAIVHDDITLVAIKIKSPHTA
jgi:serine phosphatase RsbU (regulator of sigma subunit)